MGVSVREQHKVRGAGTPEERGTMLMPRAFVSTVAFVGRKGMLRFVETAPCDFPLAQKLTSGSTHHPHVASVLSVQPLLFS